MASAEKPARSVLFVLRVFYGTGGKSADETDGCDRPTFCGGGSLTDDAGVVTSSRLLLHALSATTHFSRRLLLFPFFFFLLLLLLFLFHLLPLVDDVVVLVLFSHFLMNEPIAAWLLRPDRPTLNRVEVASALMNRRTIDSHRRRKFSIATLTTSSHSFRPFRSSVPRSRSDSSSAGRLM